MSENIGRYNVIFEILTKQSGDIERIKKESTGLNGIFNQAKATFAGMIAADVVQAGISGIKQIIGNSINMAAQFETASQSFEVLLGSASRAKTLIADLTEFSIKTPFEPAEINASAKALLGFGRGVKEVKEDINIIGNAAAATGANLQSLSVVYGQVAGLGKLQGQDALQFVNAGVPIYQVLSDYMGKSTREIKILQSQGKITFEDLRQSFIKASAEGGKFAGGLEKQSQTLAGLRSTLSGNRDEFSKSIGQSFLPLLKNVTKGWAEFFDYLLKRWLEVQPQFQKFLDFLMTTFAPAGEIAFAVMRAGFEIFAQFIIILGELPRFLKENATELKLLGLALLTLNTQLIISTAQMLYARTAVLRKMAADAAAILTTNGLSGAVKALNLAFRANPIGIIITALALLSAGMIYAYKNSETFRAVVDGIGAIFGVVADKIENAIDAIGKFVDAPGKGLLSIWDNFKKTSIENIKGMVDDIVGIFNGDNVTQRLLSIAHRIAKLIIPGYAILSGVAGDAAKAAGEGYDESKKQSSLERRSKAGGRGSLGGEKFTAKKDELAKEAELAKEDAEKERERLEEQKKTAAEAAKAAAEVAKKAAIEKLNLKYAQRENEIKLDKTFNERERQVELERLKLLKNIELKQTEQKFAPKKTSEYVTLANDIIDATKALENFEKSIRKVEVAPKIEAKFEAAGTLADFIKQSIDLKPGEYFKTEAQKIQKAIDDIKKALKVTIDPGAKKQLSAQLKELEAALVPFKDPALRKLDFVFGKTNLDQVAPQDQVTALLERIKRVKAELELLKPTNEKERQRIEGLKSELQAYDSIIAKLDDINAKKAVFEGFLAGNKAFDITDVAPQEQVDALLKRLEKVYDGLNVKPTNATELVKFDELQGNAKAIEDILSKLDLTEAQKNILAKLKANKPPSGEGFLQTFLGLSDEDFALFQTAVDRATSYAKQAAEQLLNDEIEIADKQIAKQEERVAKAKENAEKGKTDQLAIEEERLRELQEKREKYVAAQRVLSQLEILQSNAVAAAASIKAIATAFATPGGLFTGIATSIALAAQVAIIGSVIRNAFTDIPAFKEGVDAFGHKTNGKVEGPGTETSDSILSKLSKNERVIPASINREIGFDTTNAEVKEAVAFWRDFKTMSAPLTPVPSKYTPVLQRKTALEIYPKVAPEQMKVENHYQTVIIDLKKEMAAVRNSIESINITTKLDRDGFTQAIERDFDNFRRRQKIRG